MSQVTRFLPPLTLALVAAWCGTLTGGATAAGSAAAMAMLIAILLTVGAPWRDPLRLGTAGRLLPVALWLAMAASWWLSPVRRAGTVGLVLVPAFLLLPAAFAKCWRDETSRRHGLRALAGVVAGLSLWALGDVLLLGTPRAAMPLGHHTLLAAVLVTLLPLAALPVRERGLWRIAGLLAGGTGAAAVLASRSLLGAVALVIEGGVALALTRTSPRRRWAGAAVTILLGGLVVVFQGPRLARIAVGEDSSLAARSIYSAAGREAFLNRPLLGWGPGAAAWTNALFLRPRPGVNPPGEAVGELHCLPLQIAAELGGPGLLLACALAGFFALRRGAELRRSADRALLGAALLAQAGAVVVSLGTAAVAVAALPWAAAVAAGAALAALPPTSEDGTAWPVRAYAVVMALALAPLGLAQAWYDRALEAELAGQRGRAIEDLGRAVRLDPAFPLYRMRLALLRSDPGMALQAARDGRGVAMLWTVAGILGQTAGLSWTGEALTHACAADPLDPFAPMFQTQAEPSGEGAARHAAQALLAEPRLAAAVFWEGREGLFVRSLEEVRSWAGVDPGWKEALLSGAAVPPAGRTGAIDRLSLRFDTDPRESISIAAFRRRPWPTEWPLVPLRHRLLQRLDLTPATTLATSARTAFLPSICVTTPSPERHHAFTEHPSAHLLRAPLAPP